MNKHLAEIVSMLKNKFSEDELKEVAKAWAGEAKKSNRSIIEGVLREAGQPLTSAEIVKRVMSEKPNAHKPSILSELSHLKSIGVLQSKDTTVERVVSAYMLPPH